MPRSMADDLRARGFDAKQIAEARLPDGTLLSEHEPTPKRSDAWPYRSKWEALYAAYLEDRKKAGEIIEWKYEEIRLLTEEARVTEDGVKKPASRYTPDFAIWFADGRFEFHEVKGYQRPKDMKQYELARLRFPRFEFRMLTRTKAGGWQVIR